MKSNSRNSLAIASVWLSVVLSPAAAQEPTQSIAAKPAHSSQVPGIFGLADVGRVWVSGESSNDWHSAFGGGISLAFLTASNTVTATVARGEGQTGFYLGTGFMF